MIGQGRVSPSISLSINNLTHFDQYQRAFDLADLRPDYVEVLWDNFSHLSPDELVAAFEPFDVPVGFHVMWSRFNERDEEQLVGTLRRLRSHVDALDALYVSDHFASFTTDGYYLPVPIEPPCDDASLQRWAARIDQYQEVVGRQVLLENGAVLESSAHHLADVFADIRRRTGCGLLFDISNAVISELNDGQATERWVESLVGSGQPVRCHVGGFRRSGGVVLDTHDQPVHTTSVALLAELDARGLVRSVTLERDREDDPVELAAELVALRDRQARSDQIPASPASTAGSLHERMRQATRRVVYLVEPEPRGELPDHDAWVSPLLPIIDGTDREIRSVRDRLRQAAKLWLWNWDLGERRWLVLSSTIAGISLAVFRPCSPNEAPVICEIGVVIEGRPLGDGLWHLDGDDGLTPEGFEALAPG